MHGYTLDVHKYIIMFYMAHKNGSVIAKTPISTFLTATTQAHPKTDITRLDDMPGAGYLRRVVGGGFFDTCQDILCLQL